MMYLIALLALPALGFAIVHAAAPQRWTLAVAGGLLAAVLALGALGTMMGRSRTDAAVAVVNPDDRLMLQHVGYLEASRPIELAGGVAVVCVVPLAIGQLRRRQS